MNSSEYRSILGRLPIKGPTIEDMAMLCPHLMPNEAKMAFLDKDGFVACPPLRIRHGFQIVSYYKERVEKLWEWHGDSKVVTGSKNHPARLDWSYASRTLASYASGKPQGDVFYPYAYMDKAMAFAEKNWGEELILDDWKSVVEIILQDPTDLVNDRYHNDQPRTKGYLYLALDRDLGEIVNDWSMPQSELLDKAIVQMTHDRVIWHELKGGRGSYTQYNCTNCGAGLGLKCCSGCGASYKDDHFRSGPADPLSMRMVAYLQENGYHFAVNPRIARRKERKAWGDLVSKRQDH